MQTSYQCRGWIQFFLIYRQTVRWFDQEDKSTQTNDTLPAEGNYEYQTDNVVIQHGESPMKKIIQ